MAPLKTSPLREITDWSFDPWGTDEERRAWDTARKRRWIASLSAADWARLEDLVGQLSGYSSPAALPDLDAPIRVGACRPEDVCRFSGVKFGELRGVALLAWPKP